MEHMPLNFAKSLIEAIVFEVSSLVDERSELPCFSRRHNARA